MNKKSGKSMTKKAGSAMNGIWKALLNVIRITIIVVTLVALGFIIYYAVKAGQWIWHW